MNARRKSGGSWRAAELSVLLWIVLVTPAWGQTATGGIEGVVRDESGGVLPGVTVEISSPALIEGTRETTTEASGNYHFLRLPVGRYTVKFSLPGFGSYQRSDVVINSGFTATIDAQLGVGAVAETLTVTGESPLVDVRTATTQYVVTDETINTIPSSRNLFDMTKFMVGFSTGTPEVGGSLSQNYGSGWQIHGSRGNERTYFRDGLPTNSYYGGGDAPMSYGGTGANEEVNYQTTAIPAWVAHGGIAMTLVTKSGGDNFSGSVFASGFEKRMQSSNLDDELRERGVRATSGGTKAYDVDSSLGGPIKKSKVWFFGNVRIWSYTELLANQFTLQGDQLQNYVRRGDYYGKITWQINKTNRFTIADSREAIYRPFRMDQGVGQTFVSPEAANFNTQNPFNYLVGMTYTATPSNRWIYEIMGSTTKVNQRERYRPEVNPGDIPHLDIVTGVLSVAPTRIREGNPYRTILAGSATLTGTWSGSHELRTGAQYDFGGYETIRDYTEHGDIIQRYRSGVSDSVDLINSPVYTNNKARQFGAYIQDRWMVANRLTVNAGARYDYLHIWWPNQTAEAGTWMPERQIEKRDVKTWQTVVPRVGVALDVSGDAKTVLKASFSKYIGNEATGLAESLNPLFYQTNRCAWRDANLDDIAQEFEITRCAGWGGGTTTTLDPDLRRPFNREYSLGVERQIGANLKVSVMAYRREQRDMRATVNRAVPTDSYIPVVINNPLTNQPLTIYNQNPSTAGKQDNILENRTELDTNYNGIEFHLQRRFGSKGQVQGGYHYGRNLGRIVSTDPSDPNNNIFDYGAVGNDEPHQFKISGSYILPYEISFSGSFVANSGHPRVRSLNVGRALVPTLTRATQTVRLERNDEERYEPWRMLDLRVGRVFRVRNIRLEPFADVYNVLNVNTVLNQNNTVGSSLGVVSATINPRVVRVGGKLSF
ncbi:MAG TPA: TonB-dependent receptor [Vicinamibacterales bacterium]|nr:TonB-dependent receptor [Vicinamibacterales bacterium]